ncbi:helix-turn-helix domain-containing protein [Streptomyces sp. NPDC088816]|uniref:helix-turn-helix domain-containing protein n=1 Tax=Streptomyces sp. NPDC088816 TaxID=3365906 RepID=UPI003810AB32
MKAINHESAAAEADLAAEWVTTEELARELGVDQGTVRQWSQGTKLPRGIRGRGNWLSYRRDEVEKHLARQPELTGLPGVHPRELTERARELVACVGLDGRTPEEAEEAGVPFAPMPVEALLTKYRSLVRQALREPHRLRKVEPVLLEDGEAVVPGEVVESTVTFSPLGDLTDLLPVSAASVLLAAAAQALVAEHRSAEHFAGLLGVCRSTGEASRPPTRHLRLCTSTT